MNAVRSFKSGSSLDKKEFNRHILDALLDGDTKREAIVSGAINDNARWDTVKSGQNALTFPELAKILGKLDENGFTLRPEKIAAGSPLINPLQTPLQTPEFYESLRRNFEDMAGLRAHIELLQEEGKAERHFLRTVFNLFSNVDPLGKIVGDLADFDQYCRENHITFNEVAEQLAVGDKPKTAWDKIKDFRILLTAVGGMALGLGGYASGINFPDMLPEAAAGAPGAFFDALSCFAFSFVTLSLFRAFSSKNIMEDIGTMGRFLGTMTLGITIGLAVTSAMSGMLTMPEVVKDVADAKDVIEPWFTLPVKPSEWILPYGIPGAIIASTLYKAAKSRLEKTANSAKEELSGTFNKVADSGAALINRAGQWLENAGTATDMLFGKYMNWCGVPAIGLMMTSLMNKGNFDEMAGYLNLYAAVGTSMAVCGIVLAGASYAYGCRKKEFGEIGRVLGTAFGLSSSAATMPTTKEALRNIGVPQEIVNSVVPLGANFNMMGTSLYLGVITAASLFMFGMEPTPLQLATAMAIAVGTAFGAPGAPSSTIIFLDPVLSQAGFNQTQANEVFKMVLPADRFFDMLMTPQNVWGDMLVTLDIWAGKKGKGVGAAFSRAASSLVTPIKNIFTDKKPEEPGEDKNAPPPPMP